jgi:oligoendopeptidase F
MKKVRKYYAETFEITSWDTLEKELQRLEQIEISSAKELLVFWEQVSELVKILEDKVAWLYIRMTQFADKPQYRDALNDFMSQVIAKNQPYQFSLKKKFYDSPFRKELPAAYQHLSKIIASEIELFRKENIPLAIKEQELVSRYGEITSKMSVMLDGEEKTLQQLAPYLEKQDRTLREKTWKLMFARFAQDAEQLNLLFDELKDLRTLMAHNAGFENYRDFAHAEKGRFSYTSEDLLQLHEAVEKVIVPFVEEFHAERADVLGLENLRPWDFNVHLEGEMPESFSDYHDLLNKGIKTIAGVATMFGRELEAMEQAGFLDLENRKGKAPGGYCYSLFEQGSSFIFMHAVGVKRDVETFVHEAGHAMHNMMSKGQKIYQYCSAPSEVAELASMSMELISFDHWNTFYDPETLAKLRKDEIREKIKFLPWGTVVDAFQHWMYTNPEHTPAERGEYFATLLDRFKIGGDWSGLEKEKAMRWMMQLHIFQFPFYYIEYVMAQLGAIGVYRNYRKNAIKATQQYQNFLKLGYAKSVTELYQTAGVPFDFSAEYIAELVVFLRSELEND